MVAPQTGSKISVLERARIPVCCLDEAKGFVPDGEGCCVVDIEIDDDGIVFSIEASAAHSSRDEPGDLSLPSELRDF